MKIASLTWAGGELSPGLYGRTDLDKFRTGLAFAENFLISVEGGVLKRPGTYYVGRTKYNYPSDTVLREWRIANDDAYVLEMGDHYIRLYRFGTVVRTPPGHVNHVNATSVVVDGYLEIPTPYASADVRQIHLTTANDTLYLFHPGYQPMILSRWGLYDFGLVAMSLGLTAPAPTALNGTWTITIPGSEYNTYPEVYDYTVSAVYTNGEESPHSNIKSVAADLGHRSATVNLTWNAPAAAPGYVVSYYKIYKRQYGIFGYVARSDVTHWGDKNLAPSYDQVPKGTFDGFGIGWPRAGAFYKQRLVLAGSVSGPQTMWFSQPALFRDFTVSIPTQDDDGIEVELVGETRHTIQHMIQLRKFVIFTDTAEWLLETAGGGALTGATIDPTIQSYYGSRADLFPLKINERLLFVENLTNIVRDFGYDLQADQMVADDLTRMSRHLFKDKNIQSWAYSTFPYNLAYTVQSDGTLNHMTYAREHEIWGWSHSTTQGRFAEVACIPEINQNATYFLVDRVIGGVPVRCIERMEIRIDPIMQDEFYVDCGLTYSDERPGTVVGTPPDPDNVEFLGIYCPGHPFQNGDEVEYQILKQTYRCIVYGVTTDAFGVNPKYGPTFRDFPGPGLGQVRRGTQVVTGLGHLEGREVSVLADGNEVTGLVVQGGQITLPDLTFRAHVGLGYDAVLRTLDLEGDARQFGQYEPKSIAEVSVHLGNSRGLWVGVAGGKIWEMKPRQFEDYEAPSGYRNGIYPLQNLDSWSLTSQVEIQARGPFPAKILNITPDIIYGRAG